MKGSYHSTQLEKIKKDVGASYISYVTSNGKYKIKVIKDGKASLFEVFGGLEYSTPQRYEEVRQVIKDYYNNERTV